MSRIVDGIRLADEYTGETMTIADGYPTVQLGGPTGPLKSIMVTRLDPAAKADGIAANNADNTGARVCVTLISEQEDDPDLVETAMVWLNASDLDRFIALLQGAR